MSSDRGPSELAHLRSAQAAFDKAAAARDHAILDAVGAGIGLRRVAAVANCSHESVRRTVVSHARIMFSLENALYPVSYHQAAEIADHVARWADDPGGGDVAPRWREAGISVAADLRAKLAGTNQRPIPLDRDRAFALYQALLRDDRAQPRALADLAEGLSWLFRG